MTDDIVELRQALGHMKTSEDERLARPLAQKFRALIDWATSTKLNPRRSVPVRWDDTDILVCDVLCDLVTELEMAHAENDRLRAALTETTSLLEVGFDGSALMVARRALDGVEQ